LISLSLPVMLVPEQVLQQPWAPVVPVAVPVVENHRYWACSVRIDYPYRSV
jgi:hypothetical protein